MTQNTQNHKSYKLYAFDLDGTLLGSDKKIRPGNIDGLRKIAESGAKIALVSGRIASSIRRYIDDIGFHVPIVTLNGAEVYDDSGENAERIYYAPLKIDTANFIVNYAKEMPLMINFYYDHKVYSMRTEKNRTWTNLYKEQTGVFNVFLDDLAEMSNVAPSKIIFVGAKDRLDDVEAHLRGVWKNGEVYVCRSWDHYLEFMDPAATKGTGLRVLCDALNIDMNDVVAYGDEANDIPMFEAVGAGVAMKNCNEQLKKVAKKITDLTNDEDWLLKELEFILP